MSGVVLALAIMCKIENVNTITESMAKTQQEAQKNCVAEIMKCYYGSNMKELSLAKCIETKK